MNMGPLPQISFRSIENYRMPNQANETVQKALASKQICEHCKSDLSFFDFMRRKELGVGVWSSVWYCSKESCKEFRVFKYT